MIGIGVDTALELAEEASQEMVGKLEATSALSKSAMWELRHPIDAGLIFEGRPLSSVLELHAASFETITSIAAGVVQTGTEPALASVTRSRLFSIAHNAMTNALRHARASKVSSLLTSGTRGCACPCPTTASAYPTIMQSEGTASGTCALTPNE